MPRVRPLTPEQSQAESVGEWLRVGIARKDMTREQLSQRTGISYSTLKRRFRDPGTLMLRELCQIEQVIGQWRGNNE